MNWLLHLTETLPLRSALSIAASGQWPLLQSLHKICPDRLDVVQAVVFCFVHMPLVFRLCAILSQAQHSSGRRLYEAVHVHNFGLRMLAPLATRFCCAEEYAEPRGDTQINHNQGCNLWSRHADRGLIHDSHLHKKVWLHQCFLLAANAQAHAACIRDTCRLTIIFSLPLQYRPCRGLAVLSDAVFS